MRVSIFIILLLLVVIDVSATSVTCQSSSSPRTNESQPCFKPTNNIQVFTSNDHDDSSCGSLEPILHELADQIREQLNVSYHILERIDRHDNVISKLEESSRQDQLNISNHILDRLDRHDCAISNLVNNSTRNTTEVRPRDCLEVQRAGFLDSGAYMLYPDGDGEPFTAYCDMTTYGGGWTVFQRRETGIVDFYRNWAEYRDGFGDVLGEHWLGNDRIHRLVNQSQYELRVDLEDFEGQTAYTVYSSFYVEDEDDNYRLRIGDNRGTAGDSLDYHNGYRFSTKDADNDNFSGHCAQDRHGAWWYHICNYSNLNGRYYASSSSTTSQSDGINWYHWKRNWYPLKKSEMKIRPV